MGYYHNYFLGGDQSRWKGGVRPHDELVYEDLYPSTTLKFYAKDSHLKYDWQLRDPEVLSQIKWTYDGATGIQLNPEGSLQIQTSVGEFMESTPVAWGWKNGERIDFGCWYTLIDQEIGFAAEDDAMDLDSLVIDPQLIFTSFSGSLTDNWGSLPPMTMQGDYMGPALPLPRAMWPPPTRSKLPIMTLLASTLVLILM